MQRDPFVWPARRKVRRIIIRVEDPTPDLEGGPGLVSTVPLVAMPTMAPSEAAENVVTA